MQGSRFICRQESVQPSVLAPPGAGSSPGFGTLPFERAAGPRPRCGGVSGTHCLQASRGHSCCSLQAAPSSSRFHADTASIQQLSILTEAEQHHCITPGSGGAAPVLLGTLAAAAHSQSPQQHAEVGHLRAQGEQAEQATPWLCWLQTPTCPSRTGLRTPGLHVQQSCSQQGPPGDHRVNGRSLAGGSQVPSFKEHPPAGPWPPHHPHVHFLVSRKPGSH